VTFARADLAFRVAKLKPLERYKLLSSTVTPRPIACVSTLSKNRRANAAPFSFFNVFGEGPPVLAFGVNPTRPRITGYRSERSAHARIRRHFRANAPPQTAALGAIMLTGHLGEQLPQNY
jgi:flavin reductase (DIM6/NTAB) family NADH-FMN oxidoreductase RutF